MMIFQLFNITEKLQNCQNGIIMSGSVRGRRRGRRIRIRKTIVPCISASFCIYPICSFFLLFLKSVHCLWHCAGAQKQPCEEGFWRMNWIRRAIFIATDSVVPGLICVLAVQLSQTFSCPNRSKFYSRWRSNAISQVQYIPALCLSLPFFLFLSFRWSLSAPLHYTLINISEALSHIHHWIRPH